MPWRPLKHSGRPELPAFGQYRSWTTVYTSLERYVSENGIHIDIRRFSLYAVLKVSFEALIITPFSEVALEIGGAVETYWKSTAVPAIDLFSPMAGPSSRATSTTSPDLRTPPFSVNAAAANIVTLSSLSGEFVHVVVQVTRDGVPVIFPDWNLPVDDDQFDVGVADVSADQFLRLSAKLDKGLHSGRSPASAAGWHNFLLQKMCTLKDVLQVG